MSWERRLESKGLVVVVGWGCFLGLLLKFVFCVVV